jgi:hypothetical protein
MAATNGNQFRATAKIISDTLRKAVVQDDYVRVRKMCEKLMDDAASGDIQAAQFIRDTLDGKPRQQVEMTGEDGGPVALSLAVSFKRPDAD